MIVRTRNLNAALKPNEDHEVTTVQPMDGTGALTLFKMKLGVVSYSSEAALLAEIEYVPISTQGTPQYLVARFLAEYRRSQRKPTGLVLSLIHI